MDRYVRPVTWWEYVQRIAERSSQIEIAKRSDISAATISRWQRGTPQPDSAAAFARAYGRPVIEAFVAAGYLSEVEASATVTVPDIGQLSDDDLLTEIKRRMQEAGEGRELSSAPMKPAGESPVSRHLSQAKSPDPTSDDSQRGERIEDVPDYDAWNEPEPEHPDDAFDTPLRAVADSAPDWRREADERMETP